MSVKSAECLVSGRLSLFVREALLDHLRRHPCVRTVVDYCSNFPSNGA